MSAVLMQVKRLCPSPCIIENAFEKEYYWNVLLEAWRLPLHIKHFPGSNPVSIEKSDLPRLGTGDFIATLKSDGVRYLLLLTTKPNGDNEPIAIMVDRAKTMYEVEVWANEDFFLRGSVYDGELVWENESLVFVVFDVVVAKGESCVNLTYRERLQVVQNTILCASDAHTDASIEEMIGEEGKLLARNNEYELRIVPKRCVSKESIDTLWFERGGSHHRTDGLIFTQNDRPVGIGTSQSILKWKPTHSIDVRITYTAANAKWKIYANNNSRQTAWKLTVS